MGFRDFTSFNQALVAKQEWRLLQFPNSLTSRVLQARYYKNSDFLNAKVGSNPSYIWRSILWGRCVIKKGLRLRIGNGRKISVYKDNWMPRPETFKFISSQTILEDDVVPDLINANNQYNEAKLSQHFNYEDTTVILTIPLPNEQLED